MYTAEDILYEKGHKIISTPKDTTIKDALRFMVENNIGSIAIRDDGRIVGIWTERDLMRNVLDESIDINTAQIGNYMTTTLRSAPYDASIIQLLDIFLGKRFRHILIEKDNEYIGILSMGDVIKADLNKKTVELKQLKATVSWEYYENWRFQKK